MEGREEILYPIYRSPSLKSKNPENEVDIDSCDEESLPHMLSPNSDEEYDCDIDYIEPHEISSSLSSISSLHYSETDSIDLPNLLPPFHISQTDSVNSEDMSKDSDQNKSKIKKSTKRIRLKPRSSNDMPSSSENIYVHPLGKNTNNRQNTYESRSNGSSESSPRPSRRHPHECRHAYSRKEDHGSSLSNQGEHSPAPTSSSILRPPPSPTPSTLTLKTREKMIHRRSSSYKLSSLEEGQQYNIPNRPAATKQRAKTFTPHRSIQKPNVAHRRTVSFPEQEIERYSPGNNRLSSQRRSYRHSMSSQCDDPALFSLIETTRGYNNGRVCSSPDVDPQLTYTFRRCLSHDDDRRHEQEGILKTTSSYCSDHDDTINDHVTNASSSLSSSKISGGTRRKYSSKIKAEAIKDQYSDASTVHSSRGSYMPSDTTVHKKSNKNDHDMATTRSSDIFDEEKIKAAAKRKRKKGAHKGSIQHDNRDKHKTKEKKTEKKNTSKNIPRKKQSQDASSGSTIALKSHPILFTTCEQRKNPAMESVVEEEEEEEEEEPSICPKKNNTKLNHCVIQ